MRRYAQHRKSLVSMAAVAVAVAFAGCSEGVQAPELAAPVFGMGNGAPSGSHYNLNLIGTGDKTADMDGNNGHRIFVKLSGNTKIWLCESGRGAEAVDDCPPDAIFAVLDANGTDNDGAKFALPNPDPENGGITEYSVFARALGKPGDDVWATNQTCGFASDDTDQSDPICSSAILTLRRPKGGAGKFTNVSKELLYVYADLDGDEKEERVPLFGDELQDYFWSYDNNGLRIAQLRFYPVSTDVN